MKKGTLTIHEEHEFTITTISLEPCRCSDSSSIFYRISLQCSSTNLSALQYEIYSETTVISFESVHASRDLAIWEFCRESKPWLSVKHCHPSDKLSKTEELIAQKAIELALDDQEATAEAYSVFVSTQIREREAEVKGIEAEIALLKELLARAEKEGDRI